MNIEQVNQAKQKVAEKEIAFEVALETENSNKIKFAATELSNAKAELETASKLTPSETKAKNSEDLTDLYKRIKELRDAGKTYEAMELTYNGRK